MFFEARNVVVYYGNVMALNKVSINSDEGDIVTLIGSNGAGKSTALRAISGLKEITSGEIRLGEKILSGLPPQEIVSHGVAQVPEGRHVFPYMRVIENLRMGAYLRRDKKGIRQDIHKIYALFPILKSRSNQLGGSLSGGEQQMLAIGRALMAQPKLLLLDEPSLGLSPMMTAKIAETIVEINRKNNVTIILVEQNARMALKLAKRGYVIETGQIALEDRAENLQNNDHVISLYLGG